MPKEILFCSGNANKVREVRSILEGTVVVNNTDLDLPELQGSIEYISSEKCKRAAEILKRPVLVEDTALGFHALKGLPGPYIKWFMAELGHEGLNKLLTGFEDKSAQAVCTFAYCEGPGSEVHLFQGRTEGKIVPPRGPGTFGWDAIFEFEGETYAEMDKSRKNRISHRAKALAKLSEWLSTQK